jgi:hypothetical protein
MVLCICGKKKAVYGYAWKAPLACSDCKDPGMDNVENKRCEFPGCLKFPSFGDAIKRHKRFCRKHASSKHVNLCFKKCVKHGCKKHAVYGFPELEKPYYCLKHSNIHMIDLTRTMCKGFLCHRLAYYGDPETMVREYCFMHKLETHINVARRNKIDNK